MTPEKAVIDPAAPKTGPPLASLAIMVGSLSDLTLLCEHAGVEKTGFRPFLNSRLYTEEGFSLTGPVIGAPYAVMLLETLIARGARTILFWGWCGAVSPEVRIGDVIVPTSAMIDEGTSLHYGMASGDTACPEDRAADMLGRQLRRQDIPYHTGAIWTTDAIFRETHARVLHFQRRKALAVEMELSALFTVGKFRGVDVGGVLVVSDSVAALSWQQGFQEKCFRTRRREVSETVGRLCRETGTVEAVLP